MLATLRGPAQQPQWGCTLSSRWGLRSQTASEVLSCLLEPLGIAETSASKLGTLRGPASKCAASAAASTYTRPAGGQYRAQAHICSGSSLLVALPCAAPVADSCVLLWLPQLQVGVLPCPCLQAQARWPGLLALCCGARPRLLASRCAVRCWTLTTHRSMLAECTGIRGQRCRHLCSLCFPF